MMLKIRFYTQFKRDLKLAKKRHYDVTILKDVIDKLCHCEPLDPKYRDHALSDDYAGYRECHLQADWLLIYKIASDTFTLVLARTGTHSDFF